MARLYYPEGKYNCRVKKQAFTKAGTGTLQFAMAVEVLASTEQPISEPNFQRLQRLVQIPLTEKTIGRFVENLKDLGYAGHDIFQLDPDSPKFSFDLRDQDITLECKHEEYRGEKNEKWNFPMKPKSVEKAEKERIGSMASLFAKATGLEVAEEPEEPTDATFF